MTVPLRIQIVSDLHVDVAPAELRLAQGADVLLVAGDTCEGVEQGFAWLRARVPLPTPIIAVAGNHEFYRHVLPEELDKARACAADHGVTFLENAAVVSDGVRFLGCTLWTDFALSGEAYRPLAVRAARDGMNDHRRIAMMRKPWRRFTPEDAIAEHRNSRRWLEMMFATPFNGPTVVVTHHAPSRHGINAARGSREFDPAYASDLDELVARSGAALWVFGHTHQSVDIEIGRTRVVSNAHGYGAENPAYDPALVLEVART